MGKYTITLSDEAEQGIAHLLEGVNAKAANEGGAAVSIEGWIEQQIDSLGRQRHEFKQRVENIRAKVLAGEKITARQFDILAEAARQGL